MKLSYQKYIQSITSELFPFGRTACTVRAFPLTRWAGALTYALFLIRAPVKRAAAKRATEHLQSARNGPRKGKIRDSGTSGLCWRWWWRSQPINETDSRLEWEGVLGDWRQRSSRHKHRAAGKGAFPLWAKNCLCADFIRVAFVSVAVTQRQFI